LSDDLRDHLEKWSWSSSYIKNIHILFYDMKFLLYLKELKSTSRSISKLLCFFEILILDDKWLCHDCKEKNIDFLPV
jgi:hypothetical protein